MILRKNTKNSELLQLKTNKNACLNNLSLDIFY